MDAARFASFISKEIFPGSHLPTHYARTLDIWAQGLQAHRDDVIAAQSEQVYDRYLRYLTGCADMFRNRYIDINQFTLAR